MAVAYTVPTIAITGSPKDYTSIEAARRRQEAADAAKVQSEGKKKDAEIRKALYVEPGSFLPMRVPEIESAFTETINTLANSDGDFRAESDAIYKFKQLAADRQKEKKEYDEMNKGVTQGNLIARGDLSRVGSASSQDELQDLIQSGAVAVEPNTGRLQFNASKNVDFRQIWSGLGSKSKDVFKGVETASDGTQFYKFDYNLPKLQQELSATFDADPNIETKATITYERLNPESKGLKPEELRQKVKEDWVANGMEFASEGKWVRKPKPGGLTINIGQNAGGGLGENQATPYGEFPPTSKIVYTNPVSSDKESITGETENFFGFSAGNFNIVGAPPGEAIYNDSGKKIDDSQVRKSTFNQFLGRLVLTKDLEVNGVVYPKGFSVPKQYKDLAINNGVAKAAVVATGLSDNGESLSFNATGLTPSLYAAQSEAEKKQLNIQIQDAKKQADQLQAQVNKQYLAARNQRDKGNKKPAPKPATTEKPKATSASTNKRVNSNPALQKLMQGSGK